MLTNKQINWRIFFACLMIFLSACFLFVYTIFVIIGENIWEKGLASKAGVIAVIVIHLFVMFLNFDTAMRWVRIKGRIRRLEAKSKELEEAFKQELDEEFKKIHNNIK